jgi:hypothetical protein
VSALKIAASPGECGFSLIDGIGRAVEGGEATAMRRRKWGSPASGRCDEAVMGVMARAMLALQVALASNP